MTKKKEKKNEKDNASSDNKTASPKSGLKDQKEESLKSPKATEPARTSRSRSQIQSPTISSEKPKRKAADRSPSFSYSNEKIDSFTSESVSSSSQRQSAESADNQPTSKSKKPKSSADADTVTPAVGRGRPRKSIPVSATASPAEPLAPVETKESKRGRPKKSIEAAALSYVDPDLSDDEAESVQAIKPKRGRPSKTAPSSSAQSSGAAVEDAMALTGKRGRPRKSVPPAAESSFDDGVDTVDGHTIEDLEKLRDEHGHLTCSKCKVDYKSPVAYFVKHFKGCNGEVKSPRRSIAQKQSGMLESETIDEFPPPELGKCKLCPEETANVDDIFRHYATVHSALYVPEASSYRRDTSALDQVLRLTGKLVCQFCDREFNKSGFSVIIHEARCPSKVLKRSEVQCEGDGGASATGASANSKLIDGHTYTELEEMHSRDGFLKCSKCQTEYRSPVTYFVKHVRSCGVTDDEAVTFDKNLTEFPENLVSGNCIFCPASRPPVDDMLRHYATEHCVLYIDKPPGWCRSADALDVVLRLTGKINCQFCGRAFVKSGNGLVIHENRCANRPPSTASSMSDDEKSTSAMNSNNDSILNETFDENALVDGHTLKELEAMKNRDGFLTCSRCKSDYRSPVLYFAKHYHSCCGQARKVPTHLLEALAKGEHCGSAPFTCHVCVSNDSFDDAKQLQNHYMQKHACLYSPEWAEGIRTVKAREAIIKNLGLIACPKCNANYRLAPSFMYHEKKCSAGDRSQKFMEQTSIAKIVDKKLIDDINCPICDDHPAIAADEVQNHYMVTHCAVYDPKAGEKCALGSKDALEFIMQRLGYLHCPSCKNQYRSPVWYFKRHRDTCGVEPATQSSDTDSGEEKNSSSKNPKSRRQAAKRAAKLIAGIAAVDDGGDEDAKDKNFDETSKDITISTSSGESEVDSSSAGADSDKITRTKYFSVKMTKDLHLKRVYNDLNETVRQRFVPSDTGHLAISLPFRLKNLKCEFSKWTLEESPEVFIHPVTATPSFRFESDPPDKTQTLQSFQGKASKSKAPNNDAVFFAGGRIYSLDTAPLQQGDDCVNVWFAVSAAAEPDPDTRISTFVPSAVQLWRVGLEKSSSTLLAPQHAFNIAVESGPVFTLKFCPVTAVGKSIGLLAIGGSGQNLISIFVLPSESDVAKFANKSPPPLFRAPTVLQLHLYDESCCGRISPEPEASIYTKRVTCLDWSPDASILVAALNDATVALWNFDSSSPLFSMGSQGSLVAARTFRAHSQPLVAVRVIPFTKNAIITLSIDGALSLFNSANGHLLNSIMSPYSTHLTLMPGNAVPVIVNNAWFICRRVGNLGSSPKKGGSPSKMVNTPVVSGISAVDLFGDSPCSDIWPFKPILSGGSVSCIGFTKEFVPEMFADDDKPSSMPKSAVALGVITGNTTGDVTLYSTVGQLAKIRIRPTTYSDHTEKIVCSSRLLDNDVIELCQNSLAKEKKSEAADADPVATAVAPPAKNAVTLVTAIQLPDLSPVEELRSAKPRILVASALSCGLCRLSFAFCSPVSQSCSKK